jgi:MoaA/NifB/PqqE/SkfB family radical SAM enzyme
VADIIIPQSEADELFRMEKIHTEQKSYKYPFSGGSLKLYFESECKAENFIVDISRAKIELYKNKLQCRARTALVLVRLDTGDHLHRNPDGEEIPCPHIHFYKEGFGDKWAYPVPDCFTDLSDSQLTLKQFMDYVNISKSNRPVILFGVEL